MRILLSLEVCLAYGASLLLGIASARSGEESAAHPASAGGTHP